MDTDNNCLIIMPMNIPKYKMSKGVYGPNLVNHTYKPKKEHGYKAAPKDGKTRWNYNACFEYYVFNLADEHIFPDERWMNDDGRGLYSIVDGGNIPLGENDERLAFFPTTRNFSDPWHGYPTDSTYIQDRLIDYWHERGIINTRIYMKLLNHSL